MVGGWSPGLRAYQSRLPGRLASRPVALAATDVPDHSGGTAPDSNRLPIATDLERADRTVARSVRSDIADLPGAGPRRRLRRDDSQPDPDLHALGDGGETHLGDMSRVPKTDPADRGLRDRRRAQLAARRGADGRRASTSSYAEWLRHIQNDLFDVGADIAAPEDPERERLRVLPEQTAWLEERCDEVNASLAPLKSFVLPGGHPRRRPAARLPDGVPARRASA